MLREEAGEEADERRGEDEEEEEEEQDERLLRDRSTGSSWPCDGLLAARDWARACMWLWW